MSNLPAIAQQATRDDWIGAYSAWRTYHFLMVQLAHQYPVGVGTTAGVFAVLSPNNTYLANLKDTRTVLDAVAHGVPEDQVSVATYHNNRHKAFQIAYGDEPFTVLRGKKVRNFYTNVMIPDHPVAVTVDGHIHNAWRGVRESLVHVAHSMTPQLYDQIADDVRALARDLDVIPCIAQALIWFVWRRLHGIKQTPQLKLWSEEAGKIGSLVTWQDWRRFHDKATKEAERKIALLSDSFAPVA